MKKTPRPFKLSMTCLSALCAGSWLLIATSVVQAHPYASRVATNGAGQVTFVMNEGGATVTVTFEDASSINLGVLAKGSNYFDLGAHSSYSISCYKQGSGSPSVISTDADAFSIWPGNPRGVAVNKNPDIGANFGQLCVGYAGSNFIAGAARDRGLYLLNSDQSLATGPVGTAFYTPGAANGPWRIRANDDGTFLVNDFSTANANLLQFSPDLQSSNLVLSIIGQTAAALAGIHGDFFGCAIMKGSLAAGNLELYTFDSGMGVPADTNCIKGPLTFQGSFNCVFKYNIGAGPIPASGWNKRPDYAYTMGLDGIAGLRTEGDVGNDGKVYCAFGRGNASNPNLQILAPVLTTNGITGHPANEAIQAAAKSATNWLYTGGASYLGMPFNTPPAGGAAGDPWAGSRGSGANGGTYGGVRISPDGQFIASVDLNNGITIAGLTNGIPDEGTIFGINAATLGSVNTANSRGMDWDPALNIWVISSGQGLLRCYSLGLTTTCITSNDWTGTNGSFQVTLPGAKASLAVVNQNASQNYVNNTVNPGTPIPGVLRISLNTSDTTASGPVFVGFVRTGSAGYTNHYTINTNETPNGVSVFPNGVLFPGGVFTGSNGPNWNVDVKITPTASPVSGPTTALSVRLLSGTNYSAAAPLSGGIAILNTGPQLLQLSAAAPSTQGGMNRGIPNDYARFVITRLGDTNGPNNSSVSVVPKSLTVNDVRLLPPASGTAFMANYGVDYTAGPQSFTGGAPVDGNPGIVIPPGAVTVNAMIGNPVKHTNTGLTRTNLQVVICLTNGAPTTAESVTNLLSGEGYPYQVTTASLVLNEFDNALGGEVVLWSNPLTNSFDSTNWTVVYGSTTLADTNGNTGSPTLPTVVSNYDNSANFNGGDYLAHFGKPVNDPLNDAGVEVPPSDTMAANGWSTALKLSVNKNPGNAGEAGINLYPQIPGAPWNGANFKSFQGNYALRFDMYLALYVYGSNNPTIGTPAREFAAFGINHHGTNVNWRLDINPRADGTGAKPINADGEWCAIGAASGSITPADYDMFISPPWIIPVYNENGVNTNRQAIPFTTNYFIGTNATVVSGGQLVQVPYTNAYQSSPGIYLGITNVFNNAGVPNDQQSANNNQIGGAPQNGIIKNPPFSGINPNGGAPDHAWVEVSLELTRQTNLTLKVAQQPIFSSSILTPIFGVQNPLAPYTGTPMLGYLDPNIDISDYSAFVYYSNLRIVELSPFIPWTNQPVAGLIVTQGASFSLSSGATFASNPLTNAWYDAMVAGASLEGATNTSELSTTVFSATNGIATLTVNNVQSGTNYVAVWSDVAGSITSYVSRVEVIIPPGDKTVAYASTATFTVGASGSAPPTSYQWRTNGINLVNSAHYGGVTTASLSINNVTLADAGVYTCVVSNAYGTVEVAGTLTVIDSFQPYEFTGVTNLPTSVAFGFTTADPADTLSSFSLQSAGVVTGPYTNYPFGIFSGINPDFLVTVPKTNTMLFFRLKHN